MVYKPTQRKVNVVVMAVEAGSPIMQLYHDSSSLFSALVVERSWRGGGVVGKESGACRGYSVLPTCGKGDVSL